MTRNALVQMASTLSWQSQMVLSVAVQLSQHMAGRSMVRKAPADALPTAHDAVSKNHFVHPETLVVLSSLLCVLGRLVSSPGGRCHGIVCKPTLTVKDLQ